MGSAGRILAGLVLCSRIGLAQSFVISSFVGGTPPPTPIAATSLAISPAGIAADRSGNAYFTSFNILYRLDQNGIAKRLAGDSPQEYSGDGGPAAAAGILNASALAVDGQGNIFIADIGRVRRIATDGSISTVAGTGAVGFSGDGGPAANAQVTPGQLAADASGNIFFINGTRVRKISTSGIVTTVAGNGISGFAGDGGQATNAQLARPDGLAVDSAGNLYIGDEVNLTIRRVSPDGTITTVAGTGKWGMSGDGGPALAAQFTGVAGLAFDSKGNLYVSDSNPLSDDVECSCIRKISPAGIITAVDVPNLSGPRALAVDAQDNLYIAASNGVILQVSLSGLTTVAAGTGSVSFSGDGGAAASAHLSFPTGVAADSRTGNVYVSDTFNNRVRVVSPSGTITTFAGDGIPHFSGDGAPAAGSELYFPLGLATDSHGNLYIADHGNLRIRKVSSTGVITTVVDETSSPGSQVWSVAVDRQDNLYVPDAVNNRILKITADGLVTTVAGNGIHGYSGDGGPAISAEIRLIAKAALATGNDGSLYFSDDDVQPPAPGSYGTPSSPRIRRVSPNGTITTVAGNGASGYSGDGGPATQAQLGSQLNYPVGLAVDKDRNLFIGDGDNNRIRMVSADGTITTVAGTGVAGYSGDGGPATSAELSGPSSLAVDGAGNLYVADQFNNVVRVLQPTNGAGPQRQHPGIPVTR
jgi:sugar lactone lactonase YvrE